MLIFTMALYRSGSAQFVLKGQAALSYIEHFSLGIVCRFSPKHQVSLLYGSNFFIEPRKFSSYMVQYEFVLNKLKFRAFTPVAGIKGGNTIYTSEYYKWHVITIAPFIRMNCRINNKIDLLIDLGAAISLEQSLERIKFGEIEKYKELLPEIKSGLLYTF